MVVAQATSLEPSVCADAVLIPCNHTDAVPHQSRRTAAARCIVSLLPVFVSTGTPTRTGMSGLSTRVAVQCVRTYGL